MRTITFCGGSDDLVAISGAPGADELDPTREDGEFNVLSYQSNASPVSGAWDVVSSQGAVRVIALLCRNGCWTFAAVQVDEDQPPPQWNIRLRQSELTGYSAELVLDAPDDARAAVVQDARV